MNLVNKIVEFWTDQISDVNKDAGDDKLNNMGALMQLFTATKSDPADMNKFKTSLKEKLESQDLENLCMNCDYHPTGILKDAMEEAGIPKINAPWKTWLRVDKGKVLVKKGYGKPEEEL